MNKVELIELIHNGENSRVEFKRDDVTPAKLAGEMAALLNLRGGYVLLGVEKNRTISGLTRDPRSAEEWVMEVAQVHVQPATVPCWETIDCDDEGVVGIVSLPSNAPDKPYKAKRGHMWGTKVRVGTTTRNATREEEERLYQHTGRLRYGCKPVLGSTIGTLDVRRMYDYFTRIFGGSVPADDDSEAWQSLLMNLDLATAAAGQVAATIDGMLLFGRNPKRFVPQSGIRAVCYTGEVPDYAARADEDLKGPLVPLRASDGSLVEIGLVDQACDFVRRNTTPTARLEGSRRIDRWDYPDDVVREVVGNALVHRDYSIAGTDIMLEIFSNRLEVTSPGSLPNTVTPEKMRSGIRYARNQTLVNVMRDYGYVEARGMGVRHRIIPGMREHNRTQPDLIEEEHRFTVRLWRGSPSVD